MNGDQEFLAKMKIIREELSKVLDKKARERLANVRIVKPELAMELEVYLYQLYKAGHISHITEEQLVTILSELTKKKETKIKVLR
ncbi:MAG: DNA-binding protein [Candidatus Aenigmatarchaeota archaeon]